MDFSICTKNLDENADKYGAGLTERTKSMTTLRALRDAGLKRSKQFKTLEAALDYAHEIAAVVEPVGGRAQVYSLHFISI